jgi:hypothetical protein
MKNFKDYLKSLDEDKKFNEILNRKINGDEIKLNINESSLSRIWQQTLKHDAGTITAFRDKRHCGNGATFTKSENKSNNTVLKAKLLKLGYSVTKIAGTYIENYNTPRAIEVKEDSYMVVDILDKGNLRKDLITLGGEFQQDSITYQSVNGNYVLISTNKCPDGHPGKGKIGVVFKLGKSIFGKSGEFHSKINGRPFVFESVLQENSIILNKMSISEIRSMTAFSKMNIII